MLLLDTYSKDVPTFPQNTCSIMFTAALFIIARNWKQPRCFSTEEKKKKMWYIYTMEYYSAIKKKRHHEFYRQMDGTCEYHHE
jgi:tRNA(Leu) C34 or U34 (ribose-2'-O)-methylase TrmL